jgi:hypothetical protein
MYHFDTEAGATFLISKKKTKVTIPKKRFTILPFPVHLRKKKVFYLAKRVIAKRSLPFAR